MRTTVVRRALDDWFERLGVLPRMQCFLTQAEETQ